MPSVRRALDDRALVAIAVVLLAELVAAVTGDPRSVSLGPLENLLTIFRLFGPAIVAASLFYGLADDADRRLTGVIFVVGLAATVVGVAAALDWQSHDFTLRPVIGLGRAGPYGILFVVDTAAEFLCPTAVLSVGAALCARADTTRRRIVVFTVTALAVVPTTVVGFEIIPTLVEWWRGAVTGF